MSIIISLETKVYLVTEIDPMFFMIRPLKFGVSAGQKMMYQTLQQILDNCLGGAQISVGPSEIEMYNTTSNLYAITDGFYHGSGSTSNSQSLKELLLASERLKRSLGRICTSKNVKLNDSEIITYCFDETKFISLLVVKH